MTGSGPVCCGEIREKLGVIVHSLIEEVEQTALQLLPVLRRRVLGVEEGALEHLDDLVVDRLPDVGLDVPLSDKQKVVLEEESKQAVKAWRLLDQPECHLAAAMILCLVSRTSLSQTLHTMAGPSAITRVRRSYRWPTAVLVISQVSTK